MTVYNRASSFEEQTVRSPSGFPALALRSENGLNSTLSLNLGRNSYLLIISLPSLLNLALVSSLFSIKIILAQTLDQLKH